MSEAAETTFDPERTDSEAAGEANAAEAPPARRVIPVRNPATLEVVADVPVTEPDEVREAVARARVAQRAWAEKSIDERGKALKRFRDFLLDDMDRVADVIASETGKPRGEIYTSEVFYLCDAIGYWTRNAARFLRDQEVRPHLFKTKRAYSTYLPLGVVGIIGPWNFPLTLTIGEGLPALMAGNAIVVKPSEVTPRSAMVGAEVAAASGLPADLVQVVPGYGDTGAALVDAADMICFTGSVATGKKVAERAAQRLIPITLELGGKDPMIVLRDADVERAANGCVWGGLFNSGQVCMSVERVYVEEPIYDSFVQRVTEKVRKIRQGPGDGDVDIGSMTFAPQLEKVAQHVRDAAAQGARIEVGGSRNEQLPGLYYQPTVLTGVTHDMEVMREETFGPVISIMKVRDMDEAVTRANDSPFGLTASIWTRDAERGRVLARRIQAGAVCVNDALVNFALTDIPMGGVKESGLGRRHGADGIRKFCAQQSVVVDRMGAKREANWYPSNPRNTRLYRRMMRLLFRSGWRNKLRG